MHHSRSTQLNPSRIFADPAAASFAFEATEVEFGTGLGERKVRWPKACDRVRSEHSPQKLRDSPLEVGHRDPAIDTQAFNLEEHGIVRRVWRIATEDASGRDHPHRYTTPLHGVNLNRRGLRAKREAFSRVERVLRRARRVMVRNVERVEVVEIGFDLAIVFDGVTECDKDVFDALAQQGDRMAMAGARATSRHRHVDNLASSPLRLYMVLQACFDLLDLLDHRLLVRADQLAESRTHIRGDAPDRLLRSSQLALFPEVTRTKLGERAFLRDSRLQIGLR